MLRKVFILFGILLSFLLLTTSAYAVDIIFDFQGVLMAAKDGDGNDFWEDSEIAGFEATITIDSETPDSLPNDPAIPESELTGIYSPGTLELTLYNYGGESFTTTNSTASIYIFYGNEEEGEPDAEINSAANSGNFIQDPSNPFTFDAANNDYDGNGEIDDIYIFEILLPLLWPGPFESDALPIHYIDYWNHVFLWPPTAVLGLSPNNGLDISTEYTFFITDATSAPVPEPATMLLLGSGLVGLAGIRRKQFKK